MRSAIVLGGGMVGVGTALHLQSRGWSVVLVDRKEPGRETSYGNAGIIQSEAVRPYADALLALFGAERTIWGSDWPVLTLAGDYAGWLALARSIVPAADREAVFGGNAARVYGLEAA